MNITSNIKDLLKHPEYIVYNEMAEDGCKLLGVNFSNPQTIFEHYEGCKKQYDNPLFNTTQFKKEAHKDIFKDVTSREWKYIATEDRIGVLYPHQYSIMKLECYVNARSKSLCMINNFPNWEPRLKYLNTFMFYKNEMNKCFNVKLVIPNIVDDLLTQKRAEDITYLGSHLEHIDL